MQLDILDRKTIEIDDALNMDMLREFAKEVEKSLENYKFDEKNFINELSNEFNIPKEHLRELNNKIDNFLKGLYTNVGQVLYIGYDKEKNIFYEAHYDDKSITKNEMFDEYAKSHGIGTFHISFNNKHPSDNVWYREGDFIEKDIKSTIRDYLNGGNDIENISFSGLIEKYSNPEYVEYLYEKSCNE